MPRRPVVVAALLTALILGARLLFPASPLSDPAGDAIPAGATLDFPLLNLILAPLFDLWDGVTLLAMSRLHAFLIGALVLASGWAIWGAVIERRLHWQRATARLALFIAGLALFVVIGVRWRRPMARLAIPEPRAWIVDLHSHTTVSHDVTGILQDGFDLEASRAWHRRGGFDAFFVTDHNRVDGHPTTEQRELVADGIGVAACPGEELSLRRAHIVVLGNVDSIPRSAYADSLPGILRILAESESRWGGVTLASIPEYHNYFDRLPEWIAAGIDGFEVSNPAPRANEQPRWARDSVIALARANGRWLAGVTDQHGMGATVQAWTLVDRGDVSATPHLSTGEYPFICGAIVTRLGQGLTEIAQVVERHRLRVDSPWPYWATVVAVPWEGWRAAGVGQIVSWLAWIWGIAILLTLRSKRVPA
jgi:hypothetical protein